MAKHRIAKPDHVSLLKIVKNLALGIERSPPSPVDFPWSSDTAEGHKTNTIWALHKSGKGENQFVSRQIGFFVTQGQSCGLKGEHESSERFSWVTWGKLRDVQEGSDRSLWLDLPGGRSKGLFAEGYGLKTLWFTSVPHKIRLQGRDFYSMP